MKMDNQLKIIDDLASDAQREIPPVVNVANRVIYRLQDREASLERPMAFLAALAAAPAVVVLVLTINLIYNMTDPLSGIIWVAASLVG
jgi:hypothetical protein